MKKLTCAFLVLLCLLSTTAYCDGVATRMQCISNIVGWCGIDVSKTDISVVESFSDVPQDLDEYNKRCVSAAVKSEIVKGYEDATLRLEENVTRAEFACMLYRAKDFFKSSPSQNISYSGEYSDLSDWNKNEVIFCLENGYLLGYGKKFGSGDSVTISQLTIVGNRVNFGLTTREKYALLEICGNKETPFSNMLLSAYDTQLKNAVLPSRGGEQMYLSNSAELAKELETLMELQGNMDYEKFSNEDYVNHISQPFCELVYDGINRFVVISDENGKRTIAEKIDCAKNDKIKRESIFVLCPVNNSASSFVGYSRKTAVGYEYYRYSESGVPTPGGEIIGKWYKRRVNIDFTKYSSVSSDCHDLVCTYEKPEIM